MMINAFSKGEFFYPTHKPYTVQTSDSQCTIYFLYNMRKIMGALLKKKKNTNSICDGGREV